MSDATYTGSDYEAEFDDYFAILKPRVMTLVVFTAAVGLIVAPVSINPVIGFAAILFIALGAGASGALNMWWDADIDAIMRRTANRPVPGGRVSASNAMIFGLWLSVISVGMLALTSNLFSAGFLAFTIFFYAVIYTILLKRRTPQSIVIGGAAGAFPPMIGWTVATGSVSIESVLMFAIIFMWTPPHFWALALFTKEDYSNAQVPVLTVTRGRASTRRHIFWYAVLLGGVCLTTAFTSIGGPIFLLTALALNGSFLVSAYRIRQRGDSDSAADEHLVERKFFKQSLIYLFAHFAALLGDDLLRFFGLLDFWPLVI
ncbi:MAG: protoheme IX farnesyltransferase [Rhodobacteraceae bacterium]|nr:protoheme IX farnesyltransferase [Paracoccaceae bacterium]